MPRESGIQYSVTAELNNEDRDYWVTRFRV
jgi:hypothetical protein